MEELETLEVTDCPECPGPPPEFRLPPPPRPPFLTEGTFCSEAPLAELEDCVAIPMIDASYHTNPSLQSTALIITSAVILLLMAAIISVVFWKHKRKVQNLLPCKSAAGVAAAAAAAAASSSSRGRGGVLPEGQSHSGISGGGSVLYEDLPDTMSRSQRGQIHEHFGVGQLHQNHHVQQHPHPGIIPGSLHHRTGVHPTIEVRAFPEASAMVPRAPAPHHLDYLDYRDPRAILRVADKPSRAVLGGYRTPRALLAKSQEVPFAMANQTNLLSSLTTASTAHPPPHDLRRLNSLRNPTAPETLRKLSGDPITPTHRPRLRTPSGPVSPKPRKPSRRPSVDSEGYSFVDFSNEPGRGASPTERRPLAARSDSLDSEGYSYIDPAGLRRTPGVARRVLQASGEATDEEVCPLCTVQRIHGLLARPEDAYLRYS